MALVVQSFTLHYIESNMKDFQMKQPEQKPEFSWLEAALMKEGVRVTFLLTTKPGNTVTPARFLPWVGDL